MDRDGLAASVIYGPLALGLPIDDPALQDALLRGVERLGGRGVQRGRARSAVRPRVPAQPLAGGRGGRARALRGDSVTAARSSTSSTIDVGDPAWDRLWAAAEDTGLPISFHLKGGIVVGAQLPDGEVAVGRVRHGPAAAARRAARDA